MIKKIICWLLVLIWLFVIFNFSAKNSVDSSGQSRGILIGIIAEGTVIAQKVGIIDKNLTQTQLKTIISNLHKPIRKIAHLSIYFVLSILVLYALGTKESALIRNSLIVIIICFLYSLTDEYHQAFVPGRSGEIIDCIIDTCGALLGCLTYSIFKKTFSSQNTKI